MSSRNSTARRSVARSVIGGSIVVGVAGYLAFQHFREPIVEWWNSTVPSVLSGEAISISQKRKGSVVVILSEALLRDSLLNETTKNEVELLIVYPAFSGEVISIGKLPSIYDIQGKYVSHPTDVFQLSKETALRPLLRHLGTDGSVRPTIVVDADSYSKLFEQDQELVAKYIGDLVVIDSTNDQLASTIWKEKVLGVN
ncbi:hypothetical protein V1511DRAFT_514860 [Dipodascopsis uninucleata]